MKSFVVGYLLLSFLGYKGVAQNSNRFTSSRDIALQATDLVKSKIRFPAGELTIESGDDNLLVSDFIYTNPGWKPEIQYENNSHLSYLNVEIPDLTDNMHIDFDSENNDIENKWFLKLNKEIPLELDVKLGAGEGHLDLHKLKLTDLRVAMGAGDLYVNLAGSSVPYFTFKAGAGEAVIDLGGEWKNKLKADFSCGFGSLTLKLPSSVGVHVNIVGILGEVDYPGFTKEGKDYYNSMYYESDIRLDIDVVGAMGEVQLQLVD